MRYNSEILLRICQGDAYCLAVEYVDKGHPNYDLALQFDHYYARPRWGMKPGRFSDDGQMSIAVAETIISGDYHSPLAFANSFVRCFKRDPRPGYAAGFQSFLESVESGQEFLDKIIPTSDKNGAAMRSVPIGVLDDPREVLEVAKIQAAITHNTAGGIISSQAVALASHYALYDYGPLERTPLLDWMSPLLPVGVADLFSEPWAGPVVGPAVGIKTAHAVIDIVTTQKDLLSVLRRVMEYGGDCDSVAALAFSIASARMTDILPPFFEWELEPGRLYGVGFLRELGEKLIQPFYEKSMMK